ncbi:MAG: AAA-like domain-containing protein [Nostoc sp. ChiSLP01]|nr:AAA-like domain-containing protein [Nostoc sp. CmiSLP01]MDZ8286353.1 AAA-like domain-containing protein [Nostoc sp. ChiSLP01]
MVDQYIFSGSLPENASTYVNREADDELNEALLQGKFCYVLNSRQSGKSSLRVRTMSRLGEAGVECASIDLSSINIQTATQENWYADLIVKLIDSFALHVDFKGWWEQNQLNSPLLRFSNFLTKILLAEISENIVIFIDEIDSVLSLNFPTDDFFAFIRSCYNERVDNPQYNRLTFCLLGVASPTSLIQDKNRTPFNIGKAISLKGFQLHEVEPLEKGLFSKFNKPHAIMQEILQWTGGQPFLTQKLCQFMVEESAQEHPRSVEQVVRSRIIESWESQDEPEHLRTIQARILRDEQKAGYLLELYQQVRLSEEQSSVTADDTLEQSELQLSGLVIRQQGKLRIYNQIYREIFDFNWIENQLNNLRPYSENFRFWIVSGGVDESRLLRGKALQEAEEWAKDKNLSYQDKQYLAASKEKEIQLGIAAKEQEATLERERKDREASQKRNLLLTEANIKTKRQIRIGSAVLLITLFVAVILGIFAATEGNKAIIAKREAQNLQNQLASVKKDIENVQKLSQLAGELRNKNLIIESDEALRQAGLSFRVNEHNLKQALLLASISQVYQQLEKPNEVQQNFAESLRFLQNKESNITSEQGLQIQILVKHIEVSLLEEKDQTKAIKIYKEAYDIIKNYPNETNPFKNNQIVTIKNIRAIYVRLLNLLEESKQAEFIQEVRQSFKQYLFTELEYFLKVQDWEGADGSTGNIMLLIADMEGEVDSDSLLESFPCPVLKQINDYWVQYSEENFGFSIQKKIWLDTGNRLGMKDWNDNDEQNYNRFTSAVGWENEGLQDYMERVKKDPRSPSVRGGLPTLTSPGIRSSGGSWYWIFRHRLKPEMLFARLFSRTTSCKI